MLAPLALNHMYSLIFFSEITIPKEKIIQYFNLSQRILEVELEETLVTFN